MSRWQLPEGARPFDQAVGPFPEEPFLDVWMATLGTGNAVTVASGDTALPLVERDGLVTIAGDAHVTDYHSPLGPAPEDLAGQLIEARGDSAGVVLDSLPEGSARALEKGLEAAGVKPDFAQSEITAVIEVDGDYLSQLSRKQRHEVRRKHRRFVEAEGAPRIHIRHEDRDSITRFLEMHRMAEGDKGDFMTGRREGFFRSLYGSEGWEIAELTTGSTVVASAFGFRDDDAYYLYNSAYDLRYREVSPGIVMLHLLIEHLVESGCHRIDLLKGDEIYKFRMGAERRPLFRISF